MVSERIVRARALLVASLFAAAAHTTAAFGQNASDRETARSLMDQGAAAESKKDHAAALQAYEAADRLMRVPTTGIAVARAQAALGKLVDARDTALRVGRIAVKQGEPEVFAEARAEAKALANEIAERIPALTISVSGGPASGVEVRLDGAELPASMLGLPRKLDPGKHVVTATAPGFQAARAEVDLAEGAKESVKLELTPASAAPARSGATSGLAPAEDDAGGGTSPLVYVGFGVGAVGIAVGSVTGLMSLSKASAAKDECDGNVCPTSAEDDADSAKTLANVSNLGFAVGIVGIGVGIYGLLSSGSSPETPPTARARPRPVEPLIGARFVGVRGSF